MLYRRKLRRILFISLLLIVTGCEETPTDATTEPGTGSDPDNGESTELAIDSIDPEEGPPGTAVTITGDGFNPDPGENLVSIDGTEAEVDEASVTELVVIVSDDTESGAVEVEVEGETVTGPEFRVTDENGEPINGDDENGNGDEDDHENGQTYSIQGHVTDQASGNGIEGVTVTFSGEQDPIETDANGRWGVDELEVPGTVSVQSDDWEFPVKSRLVLGPSDDINFDAYTTYDTPSNTRISYQFREDCDQGLACDEPFDLWIMDSNGLNKEQLTDSDGSDQSPTWSPEADRIAFSSDRSEDGDEPTIWTMDPDGSNMEDIGIPGREPRWSPDGEHIVYVHDGNIRLMDLNGNDRELFNDGDNFASTPTWSPDGNKIAFTLNEANIYQGNTEQHIWAMTKDGDHPTRLTVVGENAPNRQPAWKPTGQSILYVSRAEAVDRFRLMDPDGRNDRVRDEWPDHTQLQPDWSPSGNQIAYTYRSMIPFSDEVKRVSSRPDTPNEWSQIAPESGAETEFWANSPAWAPE